MKDTRYWSWLWTHVGDEEDLVNVSASARFGNVRTFPPFRMAKTADIHHRPTNTQIMCYMHGVDQYRRLGSALAPWFPTKAAYTSAKSKFNRFEVILAKRIPMNDVYGTGTWKTLPCEEAINSNKQTFQIMRIKYGMKPQSAPFTELLKNTCVADIGIILPCTCQARLPTARVQLKTEHVLSRMWCLYSVTWNHSIERHRPASWILKISQQNHPYVFTIVSTMRRIKFHLFSLIVGRVNTFGYVINSSPDPRG